MNTEMELNEVKRLIKRLILIQEQINGLEEEYEDVIYQMKEITKESE
jgi:hypothetical protein